MDNGQEYLIQYLSQQSRIYSLCDDFLSIGGIATILLQLNDERNIIVVKGSESPLKHFFPSNRYKEKEKMDSFDNNGIIILDITIIQDERNHLHSLVDILMQLSLLNPTVSCLMLADSKEISINPFLRGISCIKIYQDGNKKRILECGVANQATLFRDFGW